MSRAVAKVQFEQGLQMVHRALEAALRAKGVDNVAVTHAVHGGVAPDATFSVTAHGRTYQVLFTYEEVSDSHSELPAMVRAKVRSIASSFASL